MKTYCSDCGHKVEYKTNEKPNFCPKCGFSFNMGVAAKNEQNEEGDERADAEESPNLSDDFELEFDLLEKPKASNRLSDLAGTSEGDTQVPSAPKKGRGRPKKANNEQVWEEFKQEAGGNPRREKNEE